MGYLEGPVNWQGANFRTASADACLDLMVQTGLLDESVLAMPGARESLAGAARLYIAATGKTPVRIIANSASILQDLPPELG